MCTYTTVAVPVDGSGKGPNGNWLHVSDATVYFDHPVHAMAGHTLNIDLTDPSKGTVGPDRTRADRRVGPSTRRCDPGGARRRTGRIDGLSATNRSSGRRVPRRPTCPALIDTLNARCGTIADHGRLRHVRDHRSAPLPGEVDARRVVDQPARSVRGVSPATAHMPSYTRGPARSPAPSTHGCGVIC